MFDSILGSIFGNKTETKKIVSSNVLNRIKKRKLIVQKFKNINPNDNLKRAGIAKELLSVSRTEGERKAARKFYKDEIVLNSLKNKIKASGSINEKLSLARQGKRLATKQQKEFWEKLIDRLQKRKQERKEAAQNDTKALTTDTNKEQDMEKDMEETEEEQEIVENESRKDAGSDPKEPEEVEEEEEENEDDSDEDDDEEEMDSTSDNDVNNKTEN